MIDAQKSFENKARKKTKAVNVISIHIVAYKCNLKAMIWGSNRYKSHINILKVQTQNLVIFTEYWIGNFWWNVDCIAEISQYKLKAPYLWKAHIEMKKAQILSYDTFNNLFTLFILGRSFIVILYTMNAYQHISTTSNSQVPIIFIIVDIFYFSSSAIL